MSHLHIPDGIISVWLWVLGFFVLIIYFFIAYNHLKKKAKYKKIALISVLGALMLLVMAIPIPLVIPYHINLSAFLGIIVGPIYAGLAIFSVNLILALIGHGGITMVGLNTIILTVEATFAFLLFNFMIKYLKNIFPTVFIATFIALVISTLLTVGVVYTGTQNLEYIAHKHDHSHKALDSSETGTDEETFDIKRFLLLVLITGSIGWTLESFLTAFIADYINRVRPDILENRTG